MKTEYIRRLRSTLRMFDRTLFSGFDETSSCCGVSTAECHILMELSLEEGLSLTDLAERLQVNPGNLSRTVEKMVQNSLIERRTQPENRRSISLFLTNTGRVSANEINSSYDNLFKELLSHIDESKHEMIIESINLLTQASISSKKENDFCCTAKKPDLEK
ncbi:MAG: MarR family transcriptional regulator [Spirochaetes bacterium]|jgi:DNA-binding MarR family transcriptional regulator|nr:MarR family transcriptional regulator [Spirochaetota bacterium]